MPQCRRECELPPEPCWLIASGRAEAPSEPSGSTRVIVVGGTGGALPNDRVPGRAEAPSEPC